MARPDTWEQLSGFDVGVFGVSMDDAESHKKFMAKYEVGSGLLMPCMRVGCQSDRIVSCNQGPHLFSVTCLGLSWIPQLPYQTLSDKGGAANAAFKIGKDFGFVKGRTTFVIGPGHKIHLRYNSQLQYGKHVANTLECLQALAKGEEPPTAEGE